MKKITIKKMPALTAIILFAACNTPEDKKTVTASEQDTAVRTEQPPAPETASEACYQMIIEKDTASMQLKRDGANYTGSLAYKRFEKDSNKGIVVLTENKDRLEGWYTFQSEGMTSVRQVIFKKESDALSEGYGDLDMKGDTAIFKYPATLQFESKHPFNKITCK